MKRRLDCNLYLCCPDTYLKPFPEFDLQEPLCTLIRFKLLANKRIFLKGVTISSILFPHHFKYKSTKYQIELTVQVGDLPSVRTLSKINSKVVEPLMITARRFFCGLLRSCPIRAVVLDELFQVPANCAVGICVKVFMTRTPGMNKGTYLDPREVALREEVQVDCLKDERTVLFEFLSSNDTKLVCRTRGILDILFSL